MNEQKTEKLQLVLLWEENEEINKNKGETFTLIITRERRIKKKSEKP